MRKIAFGIVALLLSLFLTAQADYTIDGKALQEYSVEELYLIEDAVMEALRAAFSAEMIEEKNGEAVGVYVVNPRTKKFHYPYCYSAVQIGADRQFVVASPSELQKQGFTPCGQCNPAPGE